MPSSIVRASENGRPFLPVGRGSIPSINDHWASDSNWNRDTIPDSQPDPELFIRHALAPASAKRIAVSRPIPIAAPVMIATLSCTIGYVISNYFLSRLRCAPW